ncbi:MAG: ABC transporter permease [Rhodocyclaceae bacterium]|jgi:lipopolysaccharide transport system permease protein|nr:ABC transporter permease [Rhodocyclaceae bacterium]
MPDSSPESFPDFSPRSGSTTPVAPPTILIHLRPRHGLARIDFGELWHYRDLLWFLAVRDIKVRYKQTALGATWAVLQPFATMVVFSVFFGHLAGMSSQIESGIPYPIYTFCALLPWQLFAQAMGASSASLVDSQNLIAKVYFPRLLIPFAAVIGSLVDFAVAFAILLAMMIIYGIPPGGAILTLPLLVAFAVLTALAVGLWLSALSAMYRDFRYTTGFLIQIWLFITPVAYPLSIVPDKWRLLYGLNPMVGVVEGFRWALLGSSAPPVFLLVVSLTVVLTTLISGMLYFRAMERTMADWV